MSEVKTILKSVDNNPPVHTLWQNTRVFHELGILGLDQPVRPEMQINFILKATGCCFRSIEYILTIARIKLQFLIFHIFSIGSTGGIQTLCTGVTIN